MRRYSASLMTCSQVADLLSNTPQLMYVPYMFASHPLTPTPLGMVITFDTFGHPGTRD